jgi:hypothetical protein
MLLRMGTKLMGEGQKRAMGTATSAIAVRVLAVGMVGELEVGDESSSGWKLVMRENSPSGGVSPCCT